MLTPRRATFGILVLLVAVAGASFALGRAARDERPAQAPQPKALEIVQPPETPTVRRVAAVGALPKLRRKPRAEAPATAQSTPPAASPTPPPQTTSPPPPSGGGGGGGGGPIGGGGD